MAVSVVMPALEMAQDTGKLLAWLKKEGDAIVKGEPLLEIETDKAVFELEAPGDGLLAGVTSKAGDVVLVGRTIAWIVAPGEQPPVESEPAAPSARAVTAVAASAEGSTRISPRLSPPISPKARRMAEEALRGRIRSMIEDGDAIPAPSTFDQVMAEAENRDGVVMLVAWQP